MVSQPSSRRREKSRAGIKRATIKVGHTFWLPTAAFCALGLIVQSARAERVLVEFVTIAHSDWFHGPIGSPGYMTGVGSLNYDRVAPGTPYQYLGLDLLRFEAGDREELYYNTATGWLTSDPGPLYQGHIYGQFDLDPDDSLPDRFFDGSPQYSATRWDGTPVDLHRLSHQSGRILGVIAESVRYFAAGDATKDGVVDFADLVALSNNFGHAGDWSSGDFDNDGTVRFRDFVALANNFQAVDRHTESIGPTVAIPEPATLLLALTACFLMSRRAFIRSCKGRDDSAQTPNVGMT
jgi:hypothetical protein